MAQRALRGIFHEGPGRKHVASVMTMHDNWMMCLNVYVCELKIVLQASYACEDKVHSLSVTSNTVDRIKLTL